LVIVILLQIIKKIYIETLNDLLNSMLMDIGDCVAGAPSVEEKSGSGEESSFLQSRLGYVM
jgi:hypothetical protein